MLVGPADRGLIQGL